jgi:hypothetical protein
MEKTELQIKLERRVAIFRASGQTQAKWCAANDLKLYQLKYWLNPYLVFQPCGIFVGIPFL